MIEEETLGKTKFKRPLYWSIYWNIKYANIHCKSLRDITTSSIPQIYLITDLFFSEILIKFYRIRLENPCLHHLVEIILNIVYSYLII